MEKVPFHNFESSIPDMVFSEVALAHFRYQAAENRVYSKYVEALGIDCIDIRSVDDIPFLPVSLFKNHDIKSGDFTPEKVFMSSGTTGSVRSRHHIKDLGLYRRSFTEAFRLFYAKPDEITLFALLPSYMEQGDSSLVYMADTLIKMNRQGRGGFFADDHDRLLKEIAQSRLKGEKVIILGVSYALLDLAEKLSPDFSGLTVMETGGMKGRRKELVREELHNRLMKGFNVETIHSEYGMTELLSQAYSSGGGKFFTPPWMKVVLRDPLDPFAVAGQGRTGAINIIDLANIHSCSFIETSDLGRINHDGSFEITGRFDNSDIRGCNLLLA